MRQDAKTRIMSHVDKMPASHGGHWVWTSKCRTGLYGEYGGTRLNGRMMGSHRAVWILHNGAIPRGVDLLHQCEVKLCCNPDHLRMGTHRENHAEAVAARGGVHWNTRRRGMVGVSGCKLSDEDIIGIVDDANDGMSRKDIAKKYKITQAYISMLLSGKTRRWPNSTHNQRSQTHDRTRTDTSA